MNWKNQLLIFLRRLIPIKAHPPAKQKRILVIATTALGDTLWTTPAIESLRKSFPESFLAALTSPIGHEVLRTNPYLNKVYLCKKSLFISFLPLWRRLYRERFDTILIYHASQRLIFPLSSMLGAGQVIASIGINKGLDKLFTDLLPAKYEHEILRRLRMGEKIGAKIYTEKLSFFTDPKEKTFCLPKGRWIALHPGSKDGFKRWPPAHFVQLGKELQKKFDCHILITGTKDEATLMEEISKAIPHSQTLDTHLSLHGFAHVLSQMDLLISNDTGPVHLACAIEVPVIALYAATDPLLCGPHKARDSLFIYKGPTCTPCIKRKCQLPFCLQQIGPQEVADMIYQKYGSAKRSTEAPVVEQE